MKKSRDTKIIYYDDELNDDFAETGIKRDSIDQNYKYIHISVYKIL